MALSSTVLIPELWTRLRDPNAVATGTSVAYPQAVMLRVLDHVQRLLALVTLDTVTTTTFTTKPHVVFYALAAVSPTAMRVVQIEVDGRTLYAVSWPELQHQHPDFLLQHGERLAWWSQIGGDLLVLAPAVARPVSVTVRYIPEPPAPTFAANDMPLPAEWGPVVLDLAEAILSIRGRREQGQAALARAQTFLLGADRTAVRR
jgi:hypothetical protein